MYRDHGCRAKARRAPRQSRLVHAPRAPFRHVSEGAKQTVCLRQSFFGVPVGHPFGALKSYLVQRNIELGNAWPAFRERNAPRVLRWRLASANFSKRASGQIDATETC